MADELKSVFHPNFRFIFVSTNHVAGGGDTRPRIYLILVNLLLNTAESFWKVLTLHQS